MDYQLTQDRNEGRNYLLWVDVLRVAASFIVVLAHVDAWGGGPSFVDTSFYSLSRVGVPLFFMLSGFLLLSKQEDTWTFLRKRAAKIIVPFIVWSIVYDVLWNHAFADTGFTLSAVASLFIRILRGPRAAHLWFFYSLIGLYAFTPILRLFVANAKRSDLWYYIVLWLICMPVLYIVLEFTPVESGFELQYFTGYVGYFLLGLVLGGLDLTPRLRWLALGIFLAGFAFTFAVFQFNLPPENNELVFRSYPSLNIVLMGSAAFLLLRRLGERVDMKHAGWLKVFSEASFGIYLVHSLIQTAMQTAWTSLGFKTASGPSLLVIPLVTIVLYFASFAVTYVLRRIPVLKWTVP
jgi:surface polysaccharide O-acyltransferase-like enzyme